MINLQTTKGLNIPCKITPLTLMYYKMEFNSSLMNDFIAMQERLSVNPSDLDDIELLKFIYVMNKSCKPDIGPFDEWVNIAWFDYGDSSLWEKVIWELAEGLFPKDVKNLKNKGSKKKTKK